MGRRLPALSVRDLFRRDGWVFFARSLCRAAFPGSDRFHAGNPEHQSNASFINGGVWCRSSRGFWVG